MFEQTNLFEFIYENYKIKNPIRLIEFFAGIGSQAKALENLKVDFEHWKICEWAIPSILAYKEIHQDYLEDYGKDFSKDLSKNELVEFLLKKGISSNYNDAMKLEQIKRLPEEKLRNIYNAIKCEHNLVNICETHAKDLEICDTDKYDYILTYSFPCQDLSLAGLGKGMSKGSGTRSGMLWEVERILLECKGNLPQILLMENVPQVIGTNNIEDFKLWQKQLEDLGYKNYVEILNAKDYGIPQNRQRAFMISILGDYNYNFPKKLKLKKRLKDMLEENVDKKYYLSQKMINCFMSDGTGKYPRKERFIQNITKENKDIGNAVTTLAGSRATDNFVVESFGNKALDEILITNNVEDGDFIDAYNRNVKKDIAGTITTRVFASNCTYVAEKKDNFIIIPENTKKGYAIAENGDGVYINRPHQKRGCVQKGMIQTIKTSADDIGVVVLGNYSPGNHNASRIVDTNGIAPTVMGNHGTVTATVVKDKTLWAETQKHMITDDGNVKRYLDSDIVEEFKEGQCADISFPNGYNKGPRVHNECPTINGTTTQSSFITKESQVPLRIRKLTPKECYRLMGFDDLDCERASKVISDSMLYHTAGDSIVVNVLMAIFNQFLEE